MKELVVVLRKEGLSKCQKVSDKPVLKDFAETESVVSKARSDRPKVSTVIRRLMNFFLYSVSDTFIRYILY